MAIDIRPGGTNALSAPSCRLMVKYRKATDPISEVGRFTEATKLRAQYRQNIEDNNYAVFLQMVFGIGPHSHPLELVCLL